MHVDEDRVRARPGRQVEIALQLDAVVVGVGDVPAELEFRFAHVLHGNPLSAAGLFQPHGFLLACEFAYYSNGMETAASEQKGSPC